MRLEVPSCLFLIHNSNPFRTIGCDEFSNFDTNSTKTNR